MDRRTRASFGALFFALMFTYTAVNAYRLYLNRRGDDGWTSTSGVKGSWIVEVRPDGAAAGSLRVDDQLLSINGRAATNGDAINEAMRHVAPGEPYTMLVRSDGEAAREVTLRTRPAPLSVLVTQYLLRMLTPFSFLLTGFVVFLLKPFDKEALLLALTLALFPALAAGYFAGFAGLAPALVVVLWAARVVAFAFFTIFFLHFFLVFPESKGFTTPLLRRFPRLESRIYLALFVVAPLGVALVMTQAGTLPALSPAWRAVARVFVIAGALCGFTYLFGGLVSLVLNYRLADANARRKMRVVVFASLLAFVPLMFLILLETFNLIAYVRPVNRWIDFALGFILPLVPMSFAYAIVRHKVIPVSLIIRRGVRYVFVSRGSFVLEMASVGVVMYFLMDALFSRTTFKGRTVGVVSGVVAIVVWSATRALHTRVIAPVIDRRFFRQAYDARLILSELGQALRTLPDVHEMCALVGTRVQEALQTENATVFLRDEPTGDFACECSSRFLEAGRHTIVSREDLRLPRDSFVVTQLRESLQPLEVDFADPQSWTRQLLAADNAESESRRREGETLRRADAALLLPVASKDQLLGIVSLGARLGDLPFSSEDRQMLSAVAGQMAFALENARLFERRAEEERLRRELEMATEVQRRIFPEEAPETDALELAGSCVPARGVGGDYYDFLLLGGGRVGVAVADVAGKGISAALLMSIVQASLRSQAQAANGRLAPLVASMNALLQKSSGTASYATFFYAQFDPAEGLLTYVNAGHNPPMLFRADDQSVEGGEGGANEPANFQTLTREGAGKGLAVALRPETTAREVNVELLTAGGPVIGLFEHFTYEQASTKVARGDVLVAFTDGVTEALNPEGEEFGEERLRAFAAAHVHLSAAELHALVVAEVRAFCRDAPQHDDLTLVVAKVK
ncbi:MAG: phosphoserine phosphatase RsbU/P [Acidobacteriota bacterium]|nr:phosphoserine phosphatase RsbU/P [Acidobacteriota bacterium]